MSNLFTLNKGPADPALFQSVCEAISATDSLILIEDAVYWSLPAYRETLLSLDCAAIYMLRPDAEARGIANTGIEPVEDAQFVELCVRHSKTLSWF